MTAVGPELNSGTATTTLTGPPDAQSNSPTSISVEQAQKHLKECCLFPFGEGCERFSVERVTKAVRLIGSPMTGSGKAQLDCSFVPI